jgi:adenylosuccinate lyase
MQYTDRKIETLWHEAERLRAWARVEREKARQLHQASMQTCQEAFQAVDRARTRYSKESAQQKGASRPLQDGRFLPAPIARRGPRP